MLNTFRIEVLHLVGRSPRPYVLGSQEHPNVVDTDRLHPLLRQVIAQLDILQPEVSRVVGPEARVHEVTGLLVVRRVQDRIPLAASRRSPALFHTAESGTAFEEVYPVLLLRHIVEPGASLKQYRKVQTLVVESQRSRKRRTGHIRVTEIHVVLVVDLHVAVHVLELQVARYRIRIIGISSSTCFDRRFDETDR